MRDWTYGVYLIVTTHFNMTKNWNDIKWIFEPDGLLRDIYVQEVTLLDWEKLIDFINLNYNLKFGEAESSQIDKDYVIRYLKDDTGEIESKVLRIYRNGVTINCHFFLSDQIEFDVDPKEIKSLQDFENIENFMISLSKTLHNQVTLTGENWPTFPLVKIDCDKEINKALTEKEANNLSENQNSILKQLSLLKTDFKMRFFPKAFGKQILKSANKEYVSTKKNKNVW